MPDNAADTSDQRRVDRGRDARDPRRIDRGRAARDPRQSDHGPHARAGTAVADRSPSSDNAAGPRAKADNSPPRDRTDQDAGSNAGGEKGESGKDDGDPKSDQKGDQNGDPGQQGDQDAKKDDKDAKPSPLSKPWVRVLIAVIVVLLLVAGGIWLYRWWTHGRYVMETNNAYLQADQVTVAAKVGGTVEEVFVADNQQVHVGDPLLRIDASSNRARVDQALAQQAQGRASIRQYEAQIDEQDAAIRQAVAAVQGAESQRRFSQAQVDRYEPLARSGSETAEKLAQLVANRDQAVSTLRQNEAQALQARRRIATLRAQIGTAQAQIEQAEAQARQAAVDVDSALLRASVDGRVGDRQVRVGAEAQVGARLLTIVPVQAIYLVANFKETQIGLMRVGQPAKIKVDALDGMEIDGTVDSFSPATGASFAVIPANNATGNFTKIVQRVPVRIRIDAGDEARKVLVPGLSVEVSVDTLGRKRDAEQRKDEARDTQDERRQRAADSIDQDRRQPASGAGR